MRTLEQALGALARQARQGLGVTPGSARQLAEVLHVLKDAKARLHHEVTLSRAALTKLESVEDRSMTVLTGAGVTLGAVEAALRTKGLSLGHLPPGAWPLELGAFLEGPYAGLRAIHGGRLEPVCVQLEGVLSDGRVVRTMPGPRNATGPDLAALFLGGGGRLGLVTEARLRAHPAASVEERVAYAFASAAHAVDFVRQLIAEGVLLAGARLQRDGDRFLAELAYAGTRAQVERDRGTAHRALHVNAGVAHQSPLAPPISRSSEPSGAALGEGQAVNRRESGVPKIPSPEPSGATRGEGQGEGLGDGGHPAGGGALLARPDHATDQGSGGDVQPVGGGARGASTGSARAEDARAEASAGTAPQAEARSPKPEAHPAPPERECAWPNVELALAAGHPLELYRLSLTSVIATGDVEGVRLDQPSPWGAAAQLAPALDPHRVLGGAP